MGWTIKSRGMIALALTLCAAPFANAGEGIAFRLTAPVHARIFHARAYRMDASGIPVYFRIRHFKSWQAPAFIVVADPDMADNYTGARLNGWTDIIGDDDDAFPPPDFGATDMWIWQAYSLSPY